MRHDDGHELARCVGRAIQRRRLSMGLSRFRFGKIAGVRHDAVSHVERGVRGQTLQTLLTFSRALGCDVSTLLAEAEVYAKWSRDDV